ncbi:MAG: glycosyltransferase family 1 protein, partial [Pseudomonadota bacterium]
STANDISEFFPQFAAKIRVIPLSGFMAAKNSSLAFPNFAKINQPYVLFVGTLEPRKNIDKLLQAFSLLPTALRKHFQLVITGANGWGNIILNKLIIKYGLQDNIFSTGYISDEQLISLYQNAYCLALPSLYEGFGLPILEAHSFGIPVLTSNLASMPEVAGDAAIYVDPKNVKSISNGLKTLLENSELRENLAQKAKKNSTKYSWEKTAYMTLAAFKEAIKLHKQNI